VPSSRPNIIPTVIYIVRQLKPRSILDVGVGFGKWGHLFREYTDILEAEHDPARYDKKNWQIRIDGIEGHTPYLTPMHTYLYDKIHVGDATIVIKTLPNYDLIFLGDIIEHFDKNAGLQLLNEVAGRANQAVVVSTPKYETAQEDLCGNELERHRSLWSETDFKLAGFTQVKTFGHTLMAVRVRPGLPKLDFNLVDLAGEDIPKLRQVGAEIRKLIPRGIKFVLVDEEQIRKTSRLENATPFLEKDGQYWGAPENDSTAIREIERMRQDNAQFIVFISSTFWWLDHYKQFQQHLRSHYLCVREDEHLVAFNLRAMPLAPGN